MATDVNMIISAVDKASSVFTSIESTAKGFATRVESSFAPVNKAMAAFTSVMGLAAGGAAIKSLISSSMEWTGEAAKLSGALGMTTEKASIFNTAMRMTGVDSDVAISAGMRLAKTLDTNEAAFTNLGVKTRDVNGNLRSTPDIMADVNMALGGLHSGTERNTAAMDIYGRSWSEVRQLLKLTPQVMQEAEAEARKLGLIVGPEGAERAKQYKKEMALVGLAGDSVKIALGEQLLPVMMDVAKFMASGGPESAKIFGRAFEGVAKIVMTAGKGIGLLGSIAYDTLTNDKYTDKDTIDRFKDFGNEMTTYWTTWGKSAEDYKVKAAEAAKTPVAPDLVLPDNSKLIKSLQESLTHYQKYYTDLVNSSRSAAEAIKKDQAELLGIRQKTSDLTLSLQQQLMTPTEKYYSTISDLEAKQKAAMAMSGDEKIKALGQLQQSWSAMSTEVKDGNDTIINKEDAVYQAMFKVRTLGKDMETEKINQIATEQEAANQLATEAERVKGLMQGLQEKITSLDGTVKGLNWQVSLQDNATPVLNNIKQLLDSIHSKTVSIGAEYSAGGGPGGPSTSDISGALAGGGPAYAGQRYLVGEKGPEILTMGATGGTVTPNSALGGVTFSGGITINTAATDAKGIARAILPEIQQLISRYS